jgi:glutamyl-tRNA synthetase
MAPSPTGLLHIGSVRTFLFNWLHARAQGGEVLLRIENTDTSREVAEATEQIQRSLAWLGIDWDGEVRFQLDRMEEAQRLAGQLVEEGMAYEDGSRSRTSISMTSSSFAPTAGPRTTSPTRSTTCWTGSRT